MFKALFGGGRIKMKKTRIGTIIFTWFWFGKFTNLCGKSVTALFMTVKVVGVITRHLARSSHDFGPSLSL